MTDRQLYIARDRSRLELRRSATVSGTLFLSSADGVAIANIRIPTAELLAMIDAADPDAMRAYLRETVILGSDDLSRIAQHRQAAAEHFDYLDSVPEADSPEGVDEHAVIELSDDIDTRLHVIERLAKILRAGTDAVEVCTLADWVIDR